MNTTDDSQIQPGQRAAVYFRVSTAEQTVANQKPDVRNLIAQRGLTVVATYEEKASAAKHRPQFTRLMEDAAKRRFDILVIWALDRFGRSLSGNINDFMALDRLGIRVISVREPWLDTAGPIRELLVAIFSWAAQQERTRLIERTKAGIANARANGTPWGRRSPSLLPESLRPAIMEQWEEEGRPDGFKGLAAVLGCRSATTAWKIWNKAQAIGKPQRSRTRPESAQDTSEEILEVG